MDTFPGGLPLQGRTNIVLTRNPEYQVKDAVAVHSVEELLEEVKKYDSRDVYVIGGDSVYRLLLPYCDTAHVTKIDRAYEADAYFPNLDEDPAWRVGSSDGGYVIDSGEGDAGVAYEFVTYERAEPGDAGKGAGYSWFDVAVDVVSAALDHVVG